MDVSDFGCQILDDGLANIPCLGRLQNLIRAESHEIIYPVQGRGAENHTLSSGTSPYSPYWGVPPPPPPPPPSRDFPSILKRGPIQVIKQVCDSHCHGDFVTFWSKLLQYLRKNLFSNIKLFLETMEFTEEEQATV